MSPVLLTVMPLPRRYDRLRRSARCLVLGALAAWAGVLPAAAESVSLVTATLHATSAGAQPFARVAVSADGRYVAFCSTARPSDMVIGKFDGPGASNVYVRDRLTGTNELITVAAIDPGRSANGACAADVQLTPDGRYVAFRSSSTNLLTTIFRYAEGSDSGFVWDRLTRTMILVDVAVDVTRAAGVKAMVLSENGRFAAFSSAGTGLSTQLIPNFRDQNGPLADLYVRDLESARTRLVSRQYALADSGAPAGVEITPLISPRTFGADGNVLLFAANYAQILPDMSALRNLYAYDWRSDSLVLVSASALTAGQLPGHRPIEVDSDTAGFALSADGRYAVFGSTAQLTLEVTGGRKQIFLRDLQAATTRSISLNPAGNAANGDSMRPIVSRDGSVIVFESLATDLVDGFSDSQGFADVFARPRAGGAVEWLSRTPISLTGGNAGASLEDVSSDGRYVSWRSTATDYLQPGTIADLNGADDLFVRDRLTRTTALRTLAAMGSTTANAASRSSTLVAGGAVAFFSDATDLVFTPQTSGTNIFAPPLTVADLSIAVTDVPDPAETGQEVTYSYAVFNDGPNTASEVTVSAPLPVGSVFVGAEGGATPVGGVVAFSLGTLNLGARVTRTMRVTYSSAHTATASATVTSASIDPATSNDSAVATTSVINVPRWTISGVVRTAGNLGVSGVTVTLGGGASRTTATAGDGSYAFADLTRGLDYRVTPSAPGYVFEPAWVAFSSLAANQRADFTATAVHSISGQVRGASNAGLPNVPVTLGGGASRTALTAADGTYVFEALTGGSAYTVTPTARGYVFTPASASYSSLTSDRRADFDATPLQRHGIFGEVRDSGGAGLGSVTVTLSGSSARSTATGPQNGSYAFPDLPGVGTYTVTPSAVGYVFTPSSRTFTDLPADQRADFVGTCRPEIAGEVIDRLGMAVTGVTVSISPALAAPVPTDGEGRYSVTGVAPGRSITVTPSRDGFTFNPPSWTITTGACGTTVDFSVTAGRFTRYFAEGATSSFFDTIFALLNATEDPASARLTYQLSTGANVVQHLEIDPRSRATVSPGLLAELASAEFSTTIESDLPLIADRTMRWDASGYGSHAETSVAQPLTTWYLAEGATLGGFSLFYLIQNPTDTDARVSITYLLPAPASPITKTYTVQPRTRQNVWVNLEDARLANAEVSAVITSSAPVIVERAMYLDRPGQFFAAGHESAGVPRPATQWYFAEGATGSYFDLFYLIANPGQQEAVIDGQYLLPDGRVLTKQYLVAGQSRFNIWADLETFEAIAGTPLGDTAVSARFTAVNGVPFIAERAMWWQGSASQWFEGHNAAGALRPGYRWALAEGEVGGPFAIETYILIANVSDRDDSVEVRFWFENGTTTAITRPVRANSRTNIDVGLEVPAAAGKRFGATIQTLRSDTPALIVVERAMYGNANGVRWAAGSDGLGTRLR